MSLLIRSHGIAKPNKDSNTIVISCSSEKAYERSYHDDNLKYTYSEILLHGGENVDLSRFNNKAPLLYQHDQNKPIGVIERAWIDTDKRLFAEVRFSESEFAQAILMQIREGVLNKTSLGYSIDELTESSEIIDGNIIEKTIATRWSAMEVSIVSVPADDSVGIETRALKFLNVNKLQTKKGNKAMPTEMEVKKKNKAVKNSAIGITDNDAASKTKDYKDGEKILKKGNAASKTKDYKDGEKILKKGMEHGMTALASEFALGKRSFADFADAMISKRMNGSATVIKDSGDLGLSQKDIGSYSIAKAIQANLTGNRSLAPLEMELSDAASVAYGRSTNGFIVPQEVLTRAFIQQTDTTNTSNLVQNEFRGGLIEQMKNQSAVLGKAQFLVGLKSNLTFTRKTSNVSAKWIAEGAPALDTDISTETFTMSPKILACTTNFSKQLLAQSSYNVESILRNDIEKEMILALDYTAIYGTGSALEPLGILGHNIQAIQYINSLSYIDIVRLRKVLKQANHNGGLYIFSPEIEEMLETTGRGNDIQNNVLSAISNYEVSNQINDGDVLLGDFSNVMVGQWGQGMEIIVDPYSRAKSLGVEITASMMMDIGVRDETAFAIAQKAPVV